MINRDPRIKFYKPLSTFSGTLPEIDCLFPQDEREVEKNTIDRDDDEQYSNIQSSFSTTDSEILKGNEFVQLCQKLRLTLSTSCPDTAHWPMSVEAYAHWQLPSGRVVQGNTRPRRSFAERILNAKVYARKRGESSLKSPGRGKLTRTW